MKTARKVEIPSRPLNMEEFHKLKDHAYNSGFWYATNYSRNSWQIREKLIEKGYPDDNVTVENSGEVFSWNFIDEAIKELKEKYVLDDIDLIERIINSKLNSGYGINRIKQYLRTKLFPSDFIDSSIDLIVNQQEDLMIEKIIDFINREKRLLNYDETQERIFKQKITQKLIGRGYSYNYISEAFELIENE